MPEAALPVAALPEPEAVPPETVLPGGGARAASAFDQSPARAESSTQSV